MYDLLSKINIEEDLVSLCLLTYNHENYIRDALFSVFNQSYPKIEIIILDDCSSDDTVKIVEEVIHHNKSDKEIRFIKHDINVGNISANVNEMIQKTKGEYIKLLSGDDILFCDCITKLVETMRRDKDISMVYANAYLVNDSFRYGDIPDVTKIFSSNLSEGYERCQFEHLMNGDYISAATAMTRRSVYETYGLHDEDVSVEDYEFWLRISRYVKFYYISKPLAFYRKSDNSLTNYFDGDRFRKLSYITKEELKVIDKYSEHLDISSRSASYISFYKKYYNFAKMAGCDDLAAGFLMKLNEYGYENVESTETPWKKIGDYLWMILFKFIDDSGWIQKWSRNNNIERVAIYGYGKIGVLLAGLFKREGLIIQYIIDKNADFKTSVYPITTLEALKEEKGTDLGVDAVILTMVRDCNSSKKRLSEFDVRVITLDEMLVDE